MIAGCGRGIPIYRKLQKDNIPFATGILYTNDVDYQLARLLAARVITEEPFCQIAQEHLREAIQVMENCKKVICADVPIGECNKGLEELIRAGRKILMKSIFTGIFLLHCISIIGPVDQF